MILAIVLRSISIISDYFILSDYSFNVLWCFHLGWLGSSFVSMYAFSNFPSFITYILSSSTFLSLLCHRVISRQCFRFAFLPLWWTSFVFPTVSESRDNNYDDIDGPWTFYQLHQVIRLIISHCFNLGVIFDSKLKISEYLNRMETQIKGRCIIINILTSQLTNSQ